MLRGPSPAASRSLRATPAPILGVIFTFRSIGTPSRRFMAGQRVGDGGPVPGPGDRGPAAAVAFAAAAPGTWPVATARAAFLLGGHSGRPLTGCGAGGVPFAPAS